jgi:microcystin-dependent protein
LAEPFIGEIKMMSFNFPPRGWAFCNGQTLSIQQNAALFSLLGTTYGGNGTTTFQLPNLQSSVPLHQGSGFVMGQTGGQENVQLNTTQLPQHNHLLAAVNSPGASAKGFDHFLAQSATTVDAAVYLQGNTNLTTLNPASLQPAGSGAPHANIQPYLALNFCIALQGIFPSRN